MACDLNRSQDQRQILDSASAMLESAYPLSRLRDGGQDSMHAICSFGAFALALPEELGGAGFSLVEEALVHVLFGRHLVSVRSLASPLAARLAVGIGRHELAAGIASGAVSVGTAIPSNGSMLLADGSDVDLALVFEGRRLDLLDIESVSLKDETGLGDGIPIRRFAAGSGKSVGQHNGGDLSNVADVLVSAQLLGVAEATRDLAVAYAGTRRQFDKPIGAFQAVKHHCANMAVAAEMLSAQMDVAAIAVRDGREDGEFQTAALRRLAPQVAMRNARICIQIHGGIGFSAEADAHHYVKRAHLLDLLGAPARILDLPAPLAPRDWRRTGNATCA